MSKHVVLTLAMIATLAASACAQQSKDKEEASVRGYSFRPEQEPFSEALLKQLRLPAGFSISVFAKEVSDARMMAVSGDGTLYVTQPDKGKVAMLRDGNGDGSADSVQDATAGLDEVHGILIQGNKVYLATVKQLYTADIQPNGAFTQPRKLGAELPDGGQHPNRTLGIGPDNMLYVSVGSDCNACDEKNPEHATLLRMGLDGSGRKVFAKGLRNTIGFGWHPQTRQMWGMDHGSDWLGNDTPPEELNLLTEGADYGWPYCYAEKKSDPVHKGPKSASKEAYCAKTQGMALGYQAHSAPIQMALYNGDLFPSDYKGDAFVAMRGSWNRKPATGYKIVRINFENGKPVGFEDFVTGFLINNGQAHFGRLAGVAVAKDGSLFFGDDTNGVIYRVTYDRRSAQNAKSSR